MPSILAAETAPAGGAALGQVFIATTGAAVMTAAVLWLVLAHRSGRSQVLQRLGALASRLSGLPPWAALPSAVAAVSLLTALLGMMWDISLHVDKGRDAGPLANPAHYFILAGLFGIFTAGIFAIAMPRKGDDVGPAALRVSSRWQVPVGGLLMVAAAGFALLGFPLDDVWHRLFGQDVTLWGPTHLMLIGGAGMTLVGMSVLLVEGARAARPDGRTGQGTAPSAAAARIAWLRRVSLMGGLLAGLSTFQGEFDFGIPQYRLVLHPLLISLAAAVVLVAARVWIGKGGALGAAVFFFVVRGVVSVIVGPILGQTMPAQPLYMPEALLVELVALALVQRRMAFGLAGGLVVGLVGFAIEKAWVDAVFRVPWTDPMLVEGLVLSVVVGLAGGVIGVLLGTGLRGQLPRPAVARGAMLGASGVVALALVWGVATEDPADVRATLAVTPVAAADGSRVDVTATFDPPSAVQDATWVRTIAWQGDGLETHAMDRVREGVYRTTTPVPAYGTWKSVVRVHKDRVLTGVPVFMPEDAAIPAPEVPAVSATRPVIEEHTLLQREQKDDVPGWLWTLAGAVVLAIYVTFLVALSWGVGRLSRRQAASRPAGSAPVSTGDRAADRAAGRPAAGAVA